MIGQLKEVLKNSEAEKGIDKHILYHWIDFTIYLSSRPHRGRSS